MNTLSLTKPLFSTGIHPTTEQETTEGTLAPGTLIKQIDPGTDALCQPVWTFLASTDGGKTWFLQVSYERPDTKSN